MNKSSARRMLAAAGAELLTQFANGTGFDAALVIRAIVRDS